MLKYDLIVIGGGISGMTAALGALKSGVKSILILERENSFGGILNQCIHNGFGEKFLGHKVTGPEYINFIEERLRESHIEIKTNSNVLKITDDKIVTYVSSEEGINDVNADAIILAMGAREVYTGSIIIPTNGLTGIFTLGDAHRLINIEGYLPGKRTVISAKNKWGFLVARRLIIEGGLVEGVVIEEDFESLRDDEIDDIIDGFNINIIENSRVIEVHGSSRIERVKIINLKDNNITEKFCDSLLLSVGFRPENTLLKMIKIDINKETLGPNINDFNTSIDGFFACGNLINGELSLIMKEVDGLNCGIKAADYIKKIH
ncbi:NAD(P)/FAD-dependent oxidoreductase [Clostridium uliginosum]|uniref:Thioredoxin reductase n=1 Tax=Clostridium uliginosum TaxID=119641 RepID=A0A1I1ID93_9CLOT|nr:FAD-dependent oxidoreductase [Clostridium uliginosum]SFC34226.1 Thioredoxin reductase [Clostridium uliginosum]